MAIRAVTTSASTIFDRSREGMARGSRKLNKVVDGISQGDYSPDLIVEMAEAEAMYGANARVIEAHHEMLGTLLDSKN